MPAMNRARDLGMRRGRALRLALADEFRETRLAAGISQQHLARITGLGQSRVSRTERNMRDALPIDEAPVHAEALGLRLHLKAYPIGSPARDASQLRLLERFRARIDDQFEWRAEARD
jgi:transcriptional regulator with XRE-family HTH domain